MRQSVKFNTGAPWGKQYLCAKFHSDWLSAYRDILCFLMTVCAPNLYPAAFEIFKTALYLTPFWKPARTSHTESRMCWNLVERLPTAQSTASCHRTREPSTQTCVRSLQSSAGSSSHGLANNYQQRKTLNNDSWTKQGSEYSNTWTTCV